MSTLLAMGLNHKSAPVELRERFAVATEEHGPILQRIRERAELAEVMVVSTCNRVEIYGVAKDLTPGPRALAEFAQLRSIDPGLLDGHLFVRGEADAARHIFRVAASLESMVVGEPQILGQLKDAFAKAKEIGVVGPILDRCLSLAIKSAKRVRTETEIARGAASIPSVAVDLATRIFGNLTGCTVLIVGAGEMAEQAAVHLRASGATEIVVVNRSEERGQTLADKIGGRYERWERLEAQLTRADVVVTSTGSTLPVIDRSTIRPVMRARRQRPLFFVDIAVPRDVDPAVGQADHVFLYNVDDLQSIVHDNLRIRAGEAERADALIHDDVEAFLQWMRSRSVGPLLGKLQHHGRTVVDAEVKRALKRLPTLDEKQRAVVEQMGRAIMQKLLHRPMTNLRKAADGTEEPPDGVALADALATLFDLESGMSGVSSDERSGPEHPAPEPTTLPRPEPS